MTSDTTAVSHAHRLADELLWPDAAAVDAGDRSIAGHLDALADAGLYGLAGPHGDQRAVWAVAEVLASGCLSTAFVWLQHQGALGRVTRADDSAARREWLRPLSTGARRAGVAVSGVRPPTPSLRATRDGAGWLLDGLVPWVTGWGMVDVVLTIAVTPDGDELWALIDPASAPTLTVEPLPLIAAGASHTVRLACSAHPVSPDRVLRIARHVPSPPGDGGGRTNGSLALGVARRACTLMGPSPLDDELVARRAQLDDADDDGMADARAGAAELALRATGRLVVHTGGSAIVADADAARLLREAAFTTVFGTRRAIRSALLTLLDRTAGTGA